MKAWINDKIELFYFLRHLIPAVFKNVRGGWFVFRDTPTWVLTRMASMETSGASEELTRLQLEAIRELRARLSMHMREIERNVEQHLQSLQDETNKDQQQ